MKNCSTLFTIFQSFYNEAKNQFGDFVHTFRSDNTHEYLSLSFQNFMDSHGILHQISYAYTPQNNGVAKCKNKHLIKTTRIMLIIGEVS